MKKSIIVLLLITSTNVFAFSLFNPKDYDECILDNMKGVTSDAAAKAIAYSCSRKFNSQEKKLECKSQIFTTSEMAKLNATGALTNYGYFTGNIYNGGQKTIHEIIIEYKPTAKSQAVTYKINNLNIRPLTSSDFNTPVHEKMQSSTFSWNFTAYGCD